MSRVLKIAGLALSVAVGAMAMAGTASARTCTAGICVSGTDDGRTVNVYPTTTLRPYTHFNVRRNGEQVEVGIGGSFHFRAKPGYQQYYYVQVCNKTGEFWTRSSCTGWVRFYHTTRA